MDRPPPLAAASGPLLPKNSWSTLVLLPSFQTLSGAVRAPVAFR